MDVIHGTWFPDEAVDFVQKGSFCLWVETDAPALTSAISRRERAPRQTTGAPRQAKSEEGSRARSEPALTPALSLWERG